MLIPRPLHMVTSVQDVREYLGEVVAPSYVIFVNHNLLDAVIFAESSDKAEQVCSAAFFTSDGNVEIFISPCAKSRYDGNPEWVWIGPSPGVFAVPPRSRNQSQATSPTTSDITSDNIIDCI